MPQPLFNLLNQLPLARNNHYECHYCHEIFDYNNLEEKQYSRPDGIRCPYCQRILTKE